MNDQTECFVDHLLNSPDVCEALENWVLGEEAGDSTAPIRFMTYLTDKLLEFMRTVDLEEAADTIRLTLQPPKPSSQPDSPARIGLWPES